MRIETTYNYISKWIHKLLANGRFSFALSEIRQSFLDRTDSAIQAALQRLVDKNEIFSILKGYYLIITPPFATKGLLPPPMYIDALMHHLGRSYYVALLNAAAYHGAAHQQPQEYFVITSFPVLRPIKKRGSIVNFISIPSMPTNLVEKLKTEAGYLNISSAGLTACDIIQYEQRIGGLERAANVLSELVEAIPQSDFTTDLLRHSKTTTLQRLGYILEYVCFSVELANSLYDAIDREKIHLYRIPLKPSKNFKGCVSENRWKVAVNTLVEIDE